MWTLIYDRFCKQLYSLNVHCYHFPSHQMIANVIHYSQSINKINSYLYGAYNNLETLI